MIYHGITNDKNAVFYIIIKFILMKDYWLAVLFLSGCYNVKPLDVSIIHVFSLKKCVVVLSISSFNCVVVFLFFKYTYIGSLKPRLIPNNKSNVM